ncbi:hypothetical protein FGB62_216g042 [Gracilaria domingensis]|nr:hypothetical protein FGB62_216g042 [Gracilaria domingensis]
MRKNESRRQNKKRRLTTGAVLASSWRAFRTSQRRPVNVLDSPWRGRFTLGTFLLRALVLTTLRTIGLLNTARPVSHHTRLEENVEPTMKRGGVAAAFSDDVDSNLRILAKEFLDDVHGMCIHERLYTLQEGNKHERWVTLEQLTPDMYRKARDLSHTRDEQFPERFDSWQKTCGNPFWTPQAVLGLRHRMRM